MLKSYLPLGPKPIELRDLLPFLFRKLYANLYRLVGLFIPFHEQIEPPEKSLPSNSQLTEEQRRQCKELFDLSEARLAGISIRASALLSTVGLLAPLELAAIGFAWKQYSNTGEMPSAVYWMFIASLFLLALAGFAAIRASNVIMVENPGIEAVIDTDNGIVRSYEIHRDAMCLLWCSMANNAIANRRFDYLRAGTSLVVLSIFILLAGGITLSTIPSGDLRQSNEIERRLNTLESKLHVTENVGQVLEKRLESIASRVQILESESHVKPVLAPNVGSNPAPRSDQPVGAVSQGDSRPIEK